MKTTLGCLALALLLSACASHSRMKALYDKYDAHCREHARVVTAEVDEEDIARCRPGQQAVIKADAFPGRVLKGQVNEITPLGDPLNKSYRVRVALPDDTPLHLGMTTELNIIVSEQPNAL